MGSASDTWRPDRTRAAATRTWSEVISSASHADRPAPSSPVADGLEQFIELPLRRRHRFARCHWRYRFVGFVAPDGLSRRRTAQSKLLLDPQPGGAGGDRRNPHRTRRGGCARHTGARRPSRFCPNGCQFRGADLAAYRRYTRAVRAHRHIGQQCGHPAYLRRGTGTWQSIMRKTTSA